MNEQDENKKGCRVTIVDIVMWVPVERFPTVTSHPVTRGELRKGGKDATAAAFNRQDGQRKGAIFSSFFSNHLLNLTANSNVGIVPFGFAFVLVK